MRYEVEDDRSGADADRSELRRGALVLTIFWWAFHYLVLTGRGLLAGFPDQWDLALRRVVAFVFGLLVCAIIYIVLERNRSKRFSSQLFVTVVLGIPSGILCGVANLVIFNYMSGGGLNADLTFPDYVNMASYWNWFFLTWAISIMALSYSIKVRREQQMRAEAQAQAHQAQMRALRYQLNPHFLFNTLNSVAALVLDHQPQAAESMLRSLSTFLRNGLAGDPLADVELAAELAQQRLYLDIEQARFPDRLNVVIDVPDQLRKAVVPSFILQPLIENAVKYGVAPSSLLTTISIGAEADGDMLKLTVRDDGGGGPVDFQLSTGTGLVNVRQRLAARFGDRHDFQAGPIDGGAGGFAATLSIPLRFSSA